MQIYLVYATIQKLKIRRKSLASIQIMRIFASEQFIIIISTSKRYQHAPGAPWLARFLTYLS